MFVTILFGFNKKFTMSAVGFLVFLCVAVFAFADEPAPTKSLTERCRGYFPDEKNVVGEVVKAHKFVDGIYKRYINTCKVDCRKPKENLIHTTEELGVKSFDDGESVDDKTECLAGEPVLKIYVAEAKKKLGENGLKKMTENRCTYDAFSTDEKVTVSVAKEGEKCGIDIFGWRERKCTAEGKCE